MQLKEKEKAFCYHYKQLGNSKEAAIQAGYSTILARHTGDKLLQQREVVDYLDKLSRQVELDTMMSSIVEGFKRMAFSPINDIVKLAILDRTSLLQTVDELDLFHISELKIPKDGCIEVKLFDRIKALEQLSEIVRINNSKADAFEFYEALEASAKVLTNDEQ